MGRILRVAGAIAAALLAVLAIAFVAFIAPRRPSPSRDLRFVGFVHLPRSGGPLSVLDYLSLYDGKLYVTSESSGTVYQAPVSGPALPDRSSIAMLPGGGAAHGVVVDPVSHRAFISRSGIDEVDAVDPATRAVLRRIRVAADVDGMIYDPADKLVYAMSGDARTANLIDPATMSLIGSIALGGAPEFAAFDPATKLIYQNLVDLNVLAVVDVGRRAVVERWPLANCVKPTGMAIDAPGRRLFVACAGDSRLLAIDLATHRSVADLPVGAGPDTVAYDPALRRIYATGRAGVMTIVRQESPDRYRALGDIKLQYGAHTLTIDPDSHRVYVGYASLLFAPRVAVFEPAS